MGVKITCNAWKSFYLALLTKITKKWKIGAPKGVPSALLEVSELKNIDCRANKGLRFANLNIQNSRFALGKFTPMYEGKLNPGYGYIRA